jgi:hypothetical protein
VEVRVSLSRTYAQLGHLARFTGEPHPALDWYQRSVEVLEPSEQQPRPTGSVAIALRDAHSARAVALTALGWHGSALHHWDRAVELDANASSTLRLSRAAARARTGDHAGAALEARQIVSKSPPGGDGYRLAAAVCALASAAVLRDVKVPSASNQQAADNYASQAVEYLDLARKLGYFRDPAHLAQLRKDPDLKSLQTFSEFRNLMIALERSAPPNR